MLIVSKSSLAYKGRFLEKAVLLVARGVRVGRMYVSSVNECCCHICSSTFNPPVKEFGHNDAWGICPNCKAPFIFEFLT